MDGLFFFLRPHTLGKFGGELVGAAIPECASDESEPEEKEDVGEKESLEH